MLRVVANFPRKTPSTVSYRYLSGGHDLPIMQMAQLGVGNNGGFDLNLPSVIPTSRCDRARERFVIILLAALCGDAHFTERTSVHEPMKGPRY